MVLSLRTWPFPRKAELLDGFRWAIPLPKPFDNSRGKFLLGFGTDVYPYVTGIEAYILCIHTPDSTGDLVGGAGRNEVVVLGIDIEERHGDIAQIYHVSAYLHLVFYQKVIVIAVFYELPECLS